MTRQVAERIGQQLRRGESEVRLALKPESLGHLHLKITTGHQHVAVHITAETPAAKEMIEQHLGQLRADLAQQGLGLSAFDVDVSTSGEDASQQEMARQQGRPRAAGAVAGEGAPEPALQPPALDNWGGHSLVGVYA